MRWLPARYKPKVETRAAGGGYTDTVLKILQARAAGSGVDVLGTASVEQAAGALSRAFASVEVEGDAHIVAALTAPVLASIGRALVRHGESLHLIAMGDDGRVTLRPAAAWAITGGPDPATWQVRATLAGPSGSVEVARPWAGCLYLAWGVDPARPWTGSGPMAYAGESARLAAEADHSIASELGGPTGSVIAVPAFGDGQLDAMTAAIKALEGSVFLAESTSAAWDRDSPSSAPRQDWQRNRLGADIPLGNVQARAQAMEGLLGAAGTPPALFNPGDGTAAREGLRRYWLSTVSPLLKLLCAEARLKLEGSCSFSFDPYVLDTPGRAKTLKTLVDSGIPLAEARALAGIDAGVIG